MDVHFTPGQEAQLAQMATKAGTGPERLVMAVLDAIWAMKPEFIEEEEMDARIEHMFSPDAHLLDCSRRRGFRGYSDQLDLILAVTV